MSIVRLGPDILASIATVGDPRNRQITALSNGGFLVSWADVGPGGGVKAQVFTAEGAAIGGELRVNTGAESDHLAPQITALSDGGFVVAWQDFSQGVGDLYAIKAQVFTAMGAATGTEILVSPTTAGSQAEPRISTLANGGFVVTWMDFDQGVAVRAQLFTAAGSAVGGEILVNAPAASDQLYPQIVALSGGGFVVTWEDDGQDAIGYVVKAQLFGADGMPAGAEILVSAATASVHGNP